MLSRLFGSETMESTGHTCMHCDLSKCPTHSVHLVGSIAYASSPAEIAPFGHSGTHASQLIQSELIINAISLPSFRIEKINWDKTSPICSRDRNPASVLLVRHQLDPFKQY
ncbi:protein of unknown function [Georgfuchsia toluolica]|uniref:Uncharacterized protein n=1 Tax=Georgfuchsia toluolica TaxID=424218 RepID=A0A916J4F5_9PROT|nr:protein of unknown function [Georgfuchsia toluolica]